MFHHEISDVSGVENHHLTLSVMFLILKNIKTNFHPFPNQKATGLVVEFQPHFEKYARSSKLGSSSPRFQGGE